VELALHFRLSARSNGRPVPSFEAVGLARNLRLAGDLLISRVHGHHSGAGAGHLAFALATQGCPLPTHCGRSRLLANAKG